MCQLSLVVLRPPSALIAFGRRQLTEDALFTLGEIGTAGGSVHLCKQLVAESVRGVILYGGFEQGLRFDWVAARHPRLAQRPANFP